MQKKVHTLICLGKENQTERFLHSIAKVSEKTQSVKELVRLGLESAKKGDVVLSALRHFRIYLKIMKTEAIGFRKQCGKLKQSRI